MSFRHSGATRSVEPGIYWAAYIVEEWIPGSRCARPGMTRDKMLFTATLDDIRRIML